MQKLTFTVDVDSALLKNFLRGREGVSRRLLTALKRREGGITCNGKPARTVDTVRRGDVIVLTLEDDKQLEANPSLSVPIAYESGDIIVFDKPSGMPVHPSIKHQGDTLGNFFAALYPDLTFRPVNRLDRDTSGLCIVAKNAHAANLLQGKCRKVYYAAVHGTTDEIGTIDAPIARQQESIILRCVRADGQPSVTHYKRLKHNRKYSLAEVRLETGRTHQIRVHFAHIGHSLAGDDMYGGSRDDISRQALHCGSLNFTEPLTNKTITVNSPLPDDMAELFREEKTMDKIASFQVDHTKFSVGMYISRIDGDIITYDVRMVKPNSGTYVSNPSLHTIEHLFATYARNSTVGKDVVYVGPMGCRTGFYLLTRDSVSREDAIKLVRDSFRFIADFDSEIPGCSAVECGNYLEHDLDSARKDVLPLLSILEKGYTPEMLEYSYHYSK